MRKKGFNDRVAKILKSLNLKALVGQSDEESGKDIEFANPEGEVYLKDLLREYKGKLYVPEQVSGANLSEEEEFDKNVKELPEMSYENFQKYSQGDKDYETWHDQVKDLLEIYKGPHNEIERQMMSFVGKLPENPHPIASSISSRMMVELGVLTAAMAAAAVGGFLASAVFSVTSFMFATAVYIIWPVLRPFIELFLGLIF